ncbi:CAMK family protein kinase [Histomonas meleagridis]|uniref:CAMK family protein kinase n=1 Tax=Histomonas meleagridis TaxID=135588 RepID=UPI00355950E6|nr:CAMK family protein kinase [Histomonas meleagridis]KAH0804519.1 CAMK family protein kinase [Histomonas meleagridis]
MNFVNRIKSTIQQGVSGDRLSGTEMSIGGINVTVGNKIADGGFGMIYLAEGSGKTYALKALQAPDEEHYQQIMNEFSIHKQCASHPNIVKVYGMTSNQSTRQATILMEYCPDNLVNRMNQVFNQGFSDSTIVEIFTQVVEAVDFIHSQNPPIIHRDLKPENVLFHEGKWKLCDFGSATKRVYTLTTASERNEAADDLEKNTTALYRAPEMCDLYRRQPIGPKSDIWALGCVLFKLCTFKDAFPDGSNLQILNLKYQWPSNKTVNPKFKEMVKFIFNPDPSKRPTAREVLSELYRQFPDWVDPKWSNQGNANNSQEPFNPYSDQTNTNSSSNSNTFIPYAEKVNSNDTFDPFSQQTNSNETFDPFSQQTNTNNTFDPFSQQTNTNKTFDPFSQQTNTNNTFDPFSQQTNTNKTFDPFAQQTNTNKTFDPFPKQTNTNRPTKQFAQSTSNNTFDPFPKQTSSLITMPVATPQPNSADLIELDDSPKQTNEFQHISLTSTTDPKLDPHRSDTEPLLFMRDLVTLPESSLSAALFSVYTFKPNSSFFLNFLHLSGTHVTAIIHSFPHFDGPMNAIFESRKQITTNYPQFEGNFALTNFMLQHKANPIPIGQPPICIDSVKLFMDHIDKVISLLRKQPTEEVAHEAFIAYQVTAYMLAKLKQFKVNEGFIVNSEIPRFGNQQDQIKRAIANGGLKTKFPQEPFNFNDPNFLKKIRPPASKSI